MLEIFDLNRKKQAVLQNAYNISEVIRINAASTFEFSLPKNDYKNSYCNPLWMVRYGGGELYRIVSSTTTDNEVVYQCEHVITTLLNRVLHGFHVVGNIGVYTADVIRYVLSKQTDWVLSTCDFTRQFEYGWENENLLGALFSIPTLFTEHYMWKFDTAVFPWKLSLKKLDLSINPQLYIRSQKNMLSLSHPIDYKTICTKLTPLGAGEGVNQLDVKSVNGGKNYLLAPQKYIDKYGIIETVWTDRRYTNPQSLLEAGRTMLNELQEPYEEYSATFAQLKGGYFDEAEVGKVAQIISENEKYNNFIVEVNRNHSDLSSSTISIANKPADIATSVADLADRQRIEMTYSQGATNLYAQSLQANADTSNGTIIKFFIPNEMRIVNKVIAKIEMSQFRAYSKATEGGGNTSTTSSSGGGGYTTSDWGGGGSTTSDSGGGFYGGGSYSSTEPNSYLQVGHHCGEPVWLNNWWDHMPTHVHKIPEMPSHSHNFSVPAISISSHSHQVSMPSHSHGFNVPAHAHSFTIPAHVHAITPGIYFFGGASGFTVYVNGVQKAVYNTTSAEIDLTAFLEADGTIPRGNFHTIEIRPNALAYICIDLMVQGFIQSRGDKTV